MSERTLRNWRRRGPAGGARPGRPPTSEAVLEEARRLVLAELERQGWGVGEGPVWRALGRAIPLARVRRVLAELKGARRDRARERRAAKRTSVRVHARDAVWALDATQVGRDGDGRPVLAEVVRDVASTRTIGVRVGPPSKDKDVVALLQRLAKRRGGAPLVLQVDNARAYRSKAVERWRLRHLVLLQRNLPRTPQHNGAVEGGMRELKESAQLEAGKRVDDVREARKALVQAALRLNGNRLRRTRGWKTAVEADCTAPHWSERCTRGEFIAGVACRLWKGVVDYSGRAAKRRAHREAILATLEELSVITRTRGGRSVSATFAERVS